MPSGFLHFIYDASSKIDHLFSKPARSFLKRNWPLEFMAKHSHTVMLPLPRLTVLVDVCGRFHLTKIRVKKVLGIIQMVVCVFFFCSATSFLLQLSHRGVFVQKSFSDCLILNSDVTLVWTSVRVDSWMRSWTHLGGLLPGKFSSDPCFLHVRIITVTVVLWSLRAATLTTFSL